MFKAVGLLGLVAATGLMGIVKAAALKERIRLLEDFRQLMLALEGQINYFREPLLRLFARVEQSDRTESDELLRLCRNALAQRQDDMETVWRESVDTLYRSKGLSEKDLEILSYAGTFLGQTDYENQRQQFTYLGEQLSAQIEEAKAAYRIKGPLYRRIGFFCGATGAILLL